MGSFCRDCVLENVNSRDYHRDSLNIIFPKFANCFLPSRLVSPHVSPCVFSAALIFLQFLLSVSYFFFLLLCNEKIKKKKKNGIGIIHLHNYHLSDTFINI